MALTRCKKELVMKKQRHCFKNPRIETYEIAMIVNEAWKKSFARIEFNKDAIAARRWYPLTRNLLDHPEISATKQNECEEIEEMDTGTSRGASNQSTAATLNFNNGIANTLMVDILQNIDREAVHQQIRMNQQKGQQALNTLAESKKLTAGLVFKSGKAWLGPNVLHEQMERKRKKKGKEKEKSDKQKREQEKRKQAYEKACSKCTNLAPSQWSVAQRQAMINYKIRKTDKWPQLKMRAQMIEVWEKIKMRPDEELPQQRTESDENVASAALLALVGGDKEKEQDDIEQLLV